MARSRLERFRDNVRNNYPNLPVQYDHAATGYVAIRVPKNTGTFERDVRVLSGLIGGHKLAVSKIADGAGWSEYWVESCHDALARQQTQDSGLWRAPIR